MIFSKSFLILDFDETEYREKLHHSLQNFLEIDFYKKSKKNSNKVDKAKNHKVFN